MFRLPKAPDRPELERLIEEARKRGPMTPEELRAQKISFVYGQLMDAAPSISREHVAFVLDHGRSPNEGEI